jgi:Tol biopolymer transport system component
VQKVDLHVVNADPSKPRKLASAFLPAMALPQFSWSPDGRRIAFVSKRDGNTEIYVTNADGSEQRRLTRSATKDRTPVWSPDGRKIAFVRSRFAAFDDIYVMNADGTGRRRVIRSGITPRWSPDGRRIAFTRAVADDHRIPHERYQTDVWVADADGSAGRNLSHSPLADDRLVGWSPAQR